MATSLALSLLAFTLGLLLEPPLAARCRDLAWRVRNMRIRRATALLEKTGYSVLWGGVSPVSKMGGRR
jgi:hypothetical protein